MPALSLHFDQDDPYPDYLDVLPRPGNRLFHLEENMKTTLKLALASSAFIMAVSANAQLLYSFESQAEVDLWADETGGPDITVSQDTIGATEGSNSMKVSLPEGGFTWFASLDTSVLGPMQDNTMIAMDITVPDANDWQNMLFVFNGPDHGWQQNDGLAVDLVEGLNQVTFDYSGYNLEDPSAAWFKLTLSLNSAAPLDVYIDNVRAVPEPGTMLVLGGVAAAAALRRRKKA